MKTPHPSTLERGPDGSYVGAVGGTGLSAEQKKAIRKTLADSHTPLFLGSVAGKAGIALNTPQLKQQVSDFVGVYLVSTGEVEMAMDGQSRKTGREIFRGFVATPHLRELLQKGLA